MQHLLLKKIITTNSLSFIFIGILALTLIIQRTLFGFEFPIPWNDETAFISQAFALSTDNTLYVWGLNQERTVMWMPPGYMILLSIFYKVFGYSYELTRWISSALYFISVITILYIFKNKLKYNLTLYIITLLLMLSTFLSPYSLTIANIARMESLHFLLITLSLLFAIKNLPIVTLALVISSAVVHYNAVYFLLPIGTFLIWTITNRRNLTIRPIELFSLCVAAIIITVYFIFVIKNIHGFIYDMQFQFEWKKIGETMSGRKGWGTLGILSIIPISFLAIQRRFSASAWLSLYGIAFIAMALNGHNMWYSFAFQTGYLLIISSLLIILPNCKTGLTKALPLAICIPLLVLQLNYAWGHHDQFSPMLKLVKTPYQPFLSKETLDRAKNEILALPPGSSISFGYSGVESFFFNELYQAQAKWGIPGHSVTQLQPIRKIDYRMHCDSSLFPSYLFMFDWDGYPRIGKNTGCKLFNLHPGE